MDERERDGHGSFQEPIHRELMSTETKLASLYTRLSAVAGIQAQKPGGDLDSLVSRPCGPGALAGAACAESGPPAVRDARDAARVAAAGPSAAAPGSALQSRPRRSASASVSAAARRTRSRAPPRRRLSGAVPPCAVP
jgi:hypothetical protein